MKKSELKTLIKEIITESFQDYVHPDKAYTPKELAKLNPETQRDLERNGGFTWDYMNNVIVTQFESKHTFADAKKVLVRQRQEWVDRLNAISTLELRVATAELKLAKSYKVQDTQSYGNLKKKPYEGLVKKLEAAKAKFK